MIYFVCFWWFLEPFSNEGLKQLCISMNWHLPRCLLDQGMALLDISQYASYSCHRHCFKNCVSRSCGSWNPLIHRVYVQRIDICKLDGHVLSCNLHLQTATRNICGLRPWKLLRSRSCPHFKLQRHFVWLLRTETDCQVDFSTQKGLGWDQGHEKLKTLKTKQQTYVLCNLFSLWCAQRNRFLIDSERHF